MEKEIQNSQESREIIDFAELENIQDEQTPMENGNVSNVRVYKEIKEPSEVEKEGFFDKNKRALAFGLAGVLVGSMFTTLLLKGCDDQKENDEPSKNEITSAEDNKTSIEDDNDKFKMEFYSLVSRRKFKENLKYFYPNYVDDYKEEYSDEDLKIKYITMEDYTTGVKELCEHFNEDLGFNYKPNQLTSFYYFANMENISNDLFKELVEEQFIPDKDVNIISNVFAITSDLKTKAGRNKESEIDFNKVFVDKNTVKICTNWQKQFNSLKNTDKTETKKVLNDLEDFIVVNPEEGYNVMPTGGKDIFNWIIADSISIRAGVLGVSSSKAFLDEINDLTTAITLLNNSFECIVNDENQKQYTK